MWKIVTNKVRVNVLVIFLTPLWNLLTMGVFAIRVVIPQRWMKVCIAQLNYIRTIFAVNCLCDFLFRRNTFIWQGLEIGIIYDFHISMSLMFKLWIYPDLTTQVGWSIQGAGRCCKLWSAWLLWCNASTFFVK